MAVHSLDAGRPEAVPAWSVPADEADRLAELLTLGISAARESDLDQIVELACDMLDVPIALLNLAYADRFKIKARFGLDADQIPRDLAFCSHAILGTDLMVVEDLRLDVRFADSPLVLGEAGLRFYAGMPLRTSRGRNIGTLCVLDRRARGALTTKQERILRRLAGLVIDKIELRRLQRADAIASRFANSTTEAFLCTNAAGEITYWNESAERLFGWSGTDALGQPVELIMPERFQDGHAAAFRRVAAGKVSQLADHPVEVPARRRDGQEFPVEVTISIWEHDGERGLGAVLRDLSERHRHRERLEYMAHHDQLTGLANRFRFFECLNRMLAAGEPLAVLVFDLDGFKAVNDTLGHGVGDTLLKALSIRLLGCIAKDAVVARLGGDEFAVLLSGDADPAAAVAAADMVLARAAEPFQIEGQAISVGMSIGVTHTAVAGRDAHDLLATADVALYEAKRAGKRRSRLFEPRMRERFIREHVLRRELGMAAYRGDFVLHYQPQVCLATGELLGCEALLRWQHVERGLCLPGEFIETLDGTEISEEIGWWTLEEGCRQIAAWDREGLFVPSVGINLFAAQFRTPDFVERVATVLAHHHLGPERIELEITETVALRQGGVAMDVLRQTRELGVGLALDDFGTGYASLSTLKRAPLTRLKIDQSFITELKSDAGDAAIVRAVLALAEGLKLRVIAEGIETQPQRALLREMGCTEGQGYLFGQPQRPDEFKAAFGPIMCLKEKDLDHPLR